MPTIKRFANCRICINPDEHNPPHFHVVLNDGRECLVEITELTMFGNVPFREIRAAMEWAERNRELLFSKFKEYNP